MNRMPLILVTLFWAIAPAAAQNTKDPLPLIGWLRVASPDPFPGQPLAQALTRHGLVEGRDYRLEVRLALGDIARMPTLATELVKERPRIIVTFGPDATRAAMAATSTIPIVAASAFVEEGLASSLARPKGNLTGVNMLVTELAPKNLEVLKEILPQVRHVAVLNDASTKIPGRPAAMIAAAEALGFELTTVNVKSPDEFETAFMAFKKAGATALVVNSSTLFAAMRSQIGELARKHQLPALCQWRAMVEAGCLASYGFPLDELFELTAEQVAKVLRGARPEDLPIVQPRRFELVVNLKVATALGLAIPPPILIRADEVIE